MPITAETFELEHFEKLERGLTVAREAYAALQNELREGQEAREGLIERIADFEEAAQETPTIEQWDSLLGCIADVKRGVRQVEELYALARDLDRDGS